MKLTNLQEDAIGKPSPWAVYCFEGPIEGYPGCGKVYLTEHQYDVQMSAANKSWRCPNCGQEANWDDENYESWLPEDK